jgi:hypothetical protein
MKMTVITKNNAVCVVAASLIAVFAIIAANLITEIRQPVDAVELEARQDSSSASSQVAVASKAASNNSMVLLSGAQPIEFPYTGLQPLVFRLRTPHRLTVYELVIPANVITPGNHPELAVIPAIRIVTDENGIATFTWNDDPMAESSLIGQHHPTWCLPTDTYDFYVIQVSPFLHNPRPIKVKIMISSLNCS